MSRERPPMKPLYLTGMPDAVHIKFTRINPDHKTWRIPIMEGFELSLHASRYGDAYTGAAINKLGWFESWDIEPEELEKLLIEKGIKRR